MTTLERRYRSVLQGLVIAQMVIAWAALYALATGDYWALGGMLAMALAGCTFSKLYQLRLRNHSHDRQGTLPRRVHRSANA